MKIKILVLTATHLGNFKFMDECHKNTFNKIVEGDVEIYYYYYDPTIDEQFINKNNSLYFKGYESDNKIGEKTLKSFSFLNDDDFDFLVRTNHVSFIHLKNLISFLKDKPKHKFYSGKKIPYHQEVLNIDFATGSCFILSKDMVDFIVKNPNKWDHNLPDDVSVGKIMNEIGVELIEKEWVKFSEIPSIDEFNSIGDVFHIRCKIEDSFNPEKQCEIIKKIHEYYIESYGTTNKY